MLAALIRAVEDLFTPPLRHVVMLSLALAVACFAGLWIAIALMAHNTSLFGWWPLDWIVDLLGALAVLFLSWLLFPAVVTMMAGFFLDRVTAAEMHVAAARRWRAAPQELFSRFATSAGGTRPLGTSSWKRPRPRWPITATVGYVKVTTAASPMRSSLTLTQ